MLVFARLMLIYAKFYVFCFTAEFWEVREGRLLCMEINLLNLTTLWYYGADLNELFKDYFSVMLPLLYTLFSMYFGIKEMLINIKK